MAELVHPARFTDAAGEYHFALVDSPPNGGANEFQLFIVPPDNAAIVRFVNVVSTAPGTVNTFTASLYGLYSFGLDQSLGYGGELVSACPVVFSSQKQSRITWATDVDTAYDNTDVNWDRVANVPLPITYLPPGAVVSINYHGSTGPGDAPFVNFAQVVVELFNPAALGLGGGNANADLYLLPALG